MDVSGEACPDKVPCFLTIAILAILLMMLQLWKVMSSGVKGTMLTQ